MPQDKLIPISQFAELSGISRANLIYYDRIGVLKPERILKNKYRYYGFRQLMAAYLVLAFKEYGMSLKEIKTAARERTPESVGRFFKEQISQVESQIHQMRQKIDMMESYLALMRQAAGKRSGMIEVKELSAQPVLFGPRSKAPTEDNWIDVIKEFFEYNAHHDIMLGFPIGSVIDKKALLEGNWDNTNRLYFRIPRSRQHIKGGLYAIGYSKGDYYSHGKFYKQLIKYIERKGYRIDGDAYEDYLLDEVTVANPEEYLMRFSIKVAVGTD